MPLFFFPCLVLAEAEGYMIWKRQPKFHTGKRIWRIGLGLAELAVLCEVGCYGCQCGWMGEIGSSVVNNSVTWGRCRKWSLGAQSLIPKVD